MMRNEESGRSPEISNVGRCSMLVIVPFQGLESDMPADAGDSLFLAVIARSGATK